MFECALIISCNNRGDIMGQISSRTRAGSRHGDGTTRGRGTQPSFLLMEFAHLWLGRDLPQLPVTRLPSSWDELLDWTEDAEKISVAISTSQHKVVRIVPLVDPKERQRVETIASIPPIDQATFFAESVVINFEMEGRTKDSTDPNRLLKVRDFAEYYKLVRRLSDLLALEGSEDNCGLNGPSQLTECVICCIETSNSILPCNHRLCESCERRWVRKCLKCPFCRTSFKSVKQIRNCAWHLSEFSQAELQKDMENLYSKMEEFWTSCEYSVATEATEAKFLPVGRQIKVTKEEDDLLISKT